MSTEHAFCRPSDWPHWRACAGKCALEDSEGVKSWGKRSGATEYLKNGKTDIEAVPKTLRNYVQAIRERQKEQETAGAKVTMLIDSKLDLSLVSGEKGAYVMADCLQFSDFEDHSILDVWESSTSAQESQLAVYAITACLQHGMLRSIRECHLHARADKTWIKSLDELYVIGAEVTEAALVSLTLKDDVAAFSHLVPGPYCETCKAKNRCPEWIKQLC